MYYPCSENKDADQLRGYREADLRLCFRPCKLLVFSRTGSSMKTASRLGTREKVQVGKDQEKALAYFCMTDYMYIYDTA